ncbi:MAG: HEPN domain-containing protein [Candidatus Nanoarchaeia archaeon]|nr:HEPN domain-containing protein [Candidatus Nanoarchaeia archaeon]
MKIEELNKLLAKPTLLNSRIGFYQKKKIIEKVPFDLAEINGHKEKSEHDLKFVSDNMNLGYFDWCITGCYYASYQIALSLIRAKGVYSKNHDATLCLLARDYFKEGITKEDIELINMFFLNYQDLLFYVQSKDKREEASYGTRYNFNKEEVEKLRIKTIQFIDKARAILNNTLEARKK